MDEFVTTSRQRHVVHEKRRGHVPEDRPSNNVVQVLLTRSMRATC